MFSKLKYILFDFSDNFKNDYLSLTKKTIIFLVAGIIMFSFKNSIDFSVSFYNYHEPSIYPCL